MLLLSMFAFPLVFVGLKVDFDPTAQSEECVAVIVTGKAAKDGRAILMKNRDAPETMNKPFYYPSDGDGTYAYVMVNKIWMGMNERGLAVMNTGIENLTFGGAGMENGDLNAWILKHCQTVEGVCFELNNTQGEIGPGKRIGGTCVGVVDRLGKGAFIEISGVGAYARFVVNGYDSEANHPRHYPGYALGPIARDAYALEVLGEIYSQEGSISWEDVAQKVSRYVHHKEQGTSSFSISGEMCREATVSAMVAVSGDPRYDGKLNCMWGEYGNPPMVGLFVPSIAYAGQPPTILDSFWDYVWQKRSYAQDASGYYIPTRVREIQSYTFFAEDMTFWKYDELTNTIPENLTDLELKTRLQGYISSAVQFASQTYIAEPHVSIHTLTHGENEYELVTVSNSTINAFQVFTDPNIEITFNVTGPPETSGFCYITIPTDLLNNRVTVTIGNDQYTVDNPPQYENKIFLNVTYTHPSQVKISVPTHVHEIVISNVRPSKTVVGEGYCQNITVAIIDPGDYPENCSVTVRADALGINDGLVGYWSFDEGIGTTAHDSSGNYNDGTVYGANWTDGKFGKALSFDGIDDYVQVSSSTSLDCISDAITIAAWVKLKQVPTEAYGLIVAGGYTYVAYAYVADSRGVRFNFGICTAPGIGDDLQQALLRQYGADLPYLPYDEWYYVVWMYDSNGYAEIFVNGNSYANTTFMSGKMYNFGRGLTVNDDAKLHNGVIDELRIYNRTLSRQEIRAFAGTGAETGAMQIQNLTLQSGSSITIAVTWNTTGVAYGNYTISACASGVAGEMNTTNNNCTGGCVTVTIPGDVDGDYAVKLADLVTLARAYSSKLEDSNWNPNADIDSNSIVGLSDLVILAQHYGKYYP